MIAIALRKRTLSPVRLVLKVTFFCCSLPQWCFFVFWGVLTRLDWTIHYDFPCFVASFISSFILVGLGSQLLGG